jgi:hypothetical protein
VAASALLVAINLSGNRVTSGWFGLEMVQLKNLSVKDGPFGWWTEDVETMTEVYKNELATVYNKVLEILDRQLLDVSLRSHVELCATQEDGSDI